MSNDSALRVTFDYLPVPAVMRGAHEMKDSSIETSTTHGETRTSKPILSVGKPNMPSARIGARKEIT